MKIIHLGNKNGHNLKMKIWIIPTSRHQMMHGHSSRGWSIKMFRLPRMKMYQHKSMKLMIWMVWRQFKNMKVCSHPLHRGCQRSKHFVSPRYWTVRLTSGVMTHREAVRSILPTVNLDLLAKSGLSNLCKSKSRRLSLNSLARTCNTYQMLYKNFLKSSTCQSCKTRAERWGCLCHRQRAQQRRDQGYWKWQITSLPTTKQAGTKTPTPAIKNRQINYSPKCKRTRIKRPYSTVPNLKHLK